MTEPNSSETADAAGGEGWAKTVVDGIADGESAKSDPSAAATGADAAVTGDDAPVADGADPDSTVVDAELVDDDVPEVPPAPGSNAEGEPISVEDLVADLERVSAERDQYLDASRRLQAEFENYKKQVAKRESDARERANDSLIGELLPVMDAFDGALANGADDVAPMRGTFLDALAKQGLERIEPSEDAFDPNLHEAVMHEPGDEADGPVVAEVMRAGYVWKGRVLRPAMVKTRG